MIQSKDMFRDGKDQRCRLVVGVLVVVILGGLVSILWVTRGSDWRQASCRAEYRLLDPGVACGDEPIIKKSSYDEFKSSLSEKITGWIRSGTATDASVYFRDLDNGPTFGINEHDQFVPASLLKLPLLVTVLDYSTAHPGTLGQRVVYRSSPGQQYPVQFFPPASSITEGVPYTVDDLLANMIEYSDNKAYYALMGFLDQSSTASALVKQEMDDLGIGVQTQGSDTLSVSVKSYLSIFHQLYFSSALPQDLAEKALGLLARTDFPHGLIAGVPSDIVVAHKFGERTIPETGEKQLHDCGIIYYPGNPYSLCIMTKGRDLNALAHLIASTSAAVYAEVDSRRI